MTVVIRVLGLGFWGWGLRDMLGVVTWRRRSGGLGGGVLKRVAELIFFVWVTRVFRR